MHRFQHSSAPHRLAASELRDLKVQLSEMATTELREFMVQLQELLDRGIHLKQHFSGSTCSVAKQGRILSTVNKLPTTQQGDSQELLSTFKKQWPVLPTTWILMFLKDRSVASILFFLSFQTHWIHVAWDGGIASRVSIGVNFSIWMHKTYSPCLEDRGDKFYGQQWNKKKKVAKEQYHINSYEGL